MRSQLKEASSLRKGSSEDGQVWPGLESSEAPAALAPGLPKTPAPATPLCDDPRDRQGSLGKIRGPFRGVGSWAHMLLAGGRMVSMEAQQPVAKPLTLRHHSATLAERCGRMPPTHG